ncbi:UDP-N-acetylglucosamine 2-epimerase (non-hydrolysing) [Colwellia chukchiensis]|uniref:UDP-N-acetylglucosamine 2-epimerase (Non-hydrolysing) n=1 Tax=Colwellia chukchiensis TaxID=641665 RepID=A0A1H7HJC9_9GAMM|nr:UDP-N-acetylglucosamine 2-epimerase [Colwellia chukchiensis]SEK49572.1 UDP-N-acetylglucosamine 2-epimerase (non-hydrolysing) [Colwellia chukchiensis]
MKKLAVFTGTRAEYSLLYWLLKFLQQDSQFDLQLYVGGTHLSAEYGNTIDEIIGDGFDVTATLDFLLPSTSPNATSKSLAMAISTSADVIATHRPDAIVILGDRYEAFGVAQAAMIAQVPIVHIHGGEITEGAYDDAIRHAITKLSHLHFTATESYRQRVIQLGELPQHVFNVGAPGIDSIKKLSLFSRQEVRRYFDDKLDKPYFMVTYHPVTLSKGGAVNGLKNLLQALTRFVDHQVIITYPNADSFGQDIIQHLEHYAQQHHERVFLVKNLGHQRYLSAVKHAEAVVGNSSSGIIEAPSLKVATVNIGDRQKGRVASQSVIHCQHDTDAIVDAITQACSAEFKSALPTMANPYGQGGASQAIYDTLKTVNWDNILQKRFFNLTNP